LLAGGVISFGAWRLLAYVTAEQGWGVFVIPLWQGLITFARVIVPIIFSTVIWYRSV